MSAPIKTEDLRKLLDDVTPDRNIGTEDHWWHSQVSDFYLDEDFGAYDDQKASDKRRILRLPRLERAAVAIAAELITARAKLEAAEKLAEALDVLVNRGPVTKEVNALHWESASEALSAWESAK